MFEQEQIDALRVLMAGAGWRNVMQPAIALRGKSALRALCIEPEQREGEWKGHDDKSLRATVRECEWMLSAWENHVRIYDINRAQAERQSLDNGNGETSEPFPE